ncbi:MAG: hypothetical protein KC613_22385 [Myxococcales bacterium]|nr:hypothetical protein [Myxococcales bacterium]
MKPSLGWAGLSRAALKRAEAQLMADSQGVRDEVGVLALHTAYANRFFPGTSVQQSRLRYALFVPWQIKALLRDRDGVKPGQARRALEQAELQLARRLPDIDGEGTIGRQTAKAGRPVSIPPSQSYWVALGAWGVLSADPNGGTPSRSELFARWDRWPEGHRGRPVTDDEQRVLEARRPLFHTSLPEAPPAFHRGKALAFGLDPDERDFLRTRLLDTRRPGDGQPSFLAALVRAGAAPSSSRPPWSRSVIRHADAADRDALLRARDAASLAAVTRALYAAAVEELQQRRDGMTPGRRHREHLGAVVDEHGAAARRLRLSDLPADGVFIGGLEGVLANVQAWLAAAVEDPLDKHVYGPLTWWELRRKGSRRARLPLSSHGREARAGWRAGETALAGPIEYRWSLVRRFLEDLKV